MKPGSRIASSLLPLPLAAALASALGCAPPPDQSIDDDTSQAVTLVKQGISRPRGGGNNTSPTANPLPSTYQGGPILQPELVPLYWGDFTAAQITAMDTYLANLTKHISGGTAPAGKEPATFQYGIYGAVMHAHTVDTAMPSHNGVMGHAVESDVTAKISSLQSASKLAGYGAERLIMVFTHGITFDDGYGVADETGWCGYHTDLGVNKYFSLNPYPYTSNCGSTGFGSFDANGIWQSQSSHEVFEAATDPQGNSGWVAQDPSDPKKKPEIGDTCNWGLNADNTVAMSFGAVQTVADKLQSACSIWTKQQVPDTAATSWASNELDITVLGSDHHMYHKRWDGTTWLPTKTADYEVLGGSFVGPPAAVSAGLNKLDIVAEGTDHAYWRKHTTTGTSWVPQTGWENLGGSFSGRPAIIAPSSTEVDVFGLKTDGQIQQKVWNGSTWAPSQTTWKPLGGTFNSPPTAVVFAPNQFFVFAVKNDGAMYYNLWNGSSFSGWQSLGGVFTSPPTAVSWGTNRVDLFGVGTDQAVYHKTFTGSWSGTWEPMGGAAVGHLNAVSWAPNRIDLFTVGTDAALYHKVWNGTMWSGWESLGDTLSSGSAVVSWGANRLDVFGRTTDGTEHHRVWNGGPSWSVWESLGGSLQ